MPRVTLELVERSPQCINAAKLRELSLRGNHIEVIENLGATKDMYECLDFSDNGILKVSALPSLKRLKTLLLCNNHIQRLALDAFEGCPNLESVVLTKNKLKSLADLLSLKGCKNLQRLTCRENEIATHEHYRSYVIYILRETKLRVLDFQKVTEKERVAAVHLFEASQPSLLGKIAPVRVSKEEEHAAKRAKLTPDQQLLYQKLIAGAQTAAEIGFLQTAFEKGEIPPESREGLHEVMLAQQTVSAQAVA